MAEVILALDLPHPDDARRLLDRIPELRWVKVGPALLTRAGAPFVQELRRRRLQVFLDLKWHDIPNTVARASAEAARLGVAMLDLHLSGGAAMIRRAVDEVEATCTLNQIRRPALLGITVLTSLGDESLPALGIQRTAQEQVLASGFVPDELANRYAEVSDELLGAIEREQPTLSLGGRS